MQKILFIFPNQLFESHYGFQYKPDKIVLIEDSLFFNDYQYSVNFHKQKLILHRASMKAYEKFLEKSGFFTDYIDSRATILKTVFEKYKNTQLILMDPVDFELKKRLLQKIHTYQLDVTWIEHQGFINTSTENHQYKSNKTRWIMADFYRFQRKRLDILMENGKPLGGKWSFDKDNRKKIPKKEQYLIPDLTFPKLNDDVIEAKSYTEECFPNASGKANHFYYPTTHSEAKEWLAQFLTERFSQFGPYEDAIVTDKSWLYHSVLTPMLNIGLLTPDYVVSEALNHAQKHSIPISSLEGFIRQIIGWREFVRASYSDLGTQMRTTNHWGHTNSLPSSFYDATTGIQPLDDTINKVLETAYCHHIERLMVLGGFMFLCEIHPDEVYQWFMELFIDSYDWVMVPNIYSMSQNSDGGLITSKPYFSGSSYLKRMGYEKANGKKSQEWMEIWDALYWRWIWKNRIILRKNPRWAMMCSVCEKMEDRKLNHHIATAEQFLSKLKK